MALNTSIGYMRWWHGILHGSFHFVCLTDRSEGVRAEVQCLPIPDLALPEGIPERGWKKLTTFESNLHGLQGTALFS
jgi:hypothetical protein